MFFQYNVDNYFAVTSRETIMNDAFQEIFKTASKSTLKQSRGVITHEADNGEEGLRRRRRRGDVVRWRGLGRSLKKYFCF